jgi:hypothetical protein
MMCQMPVRYLGLVLSLVLGVACASQQKARDQIQTLQTEALADAKNGQAMNARSKLLEAERIGGEWGLGRDPVTARTRMALGALYAQAFKDERRGVAYMIEALDTTPDAKLPAGLATPRARKALATAREKVAGDMQDSASSAPSGSSVMSEAASEQTDDPDPPEKPAPTAAKAEPPPPAPAPAPAKAAPPPAPAPPAAKEAASPPGEKERLARAETERLLGEIAAPKAPASPPAPAPAAPAAAAPAPAAAAAGTNAKKKDDVLAVLAEERKVASASVFVSPYPAGRIDPVYCPIPIETPPEQKVILRCAVRPDLKASELLLSYRPAGTESFTTVPMPRSDRGWFRGVVPASATNGKMLQFFVEARGGDKANSGTADSPNLLVVKEGAVPVEEAVAQEVGEVRDRGDDDETEGEVSARNDDNPLAGIDRQRAAERGRRRPMGAFWASMGLGTGYGWQPGGKLEFRQEREITSGGLPGGLFHFMPEFGYQLMEHLSISLQARLQYVPEDGFGDPIGGTPANRAFSLLAKGTYFFDVLEDRLQALATAAVGGGDGFRLQVPADRGVELVRSDTVRGGPVLLGAGGGLVYNFNRNLSIPAEARILVGFPSTALMFDIGVGVAYAF